MEGVNMKKLFQDLRLDPKNEEHKAEIISFIAELRAGTEDEQKDADRFEAHYGVKVKVEVEEVKKPTKKPTKKVEKPTKKTKKAK